MPRPIHIVPHLTTEALRERHCSSTDAVERRRFQVVWLAAQGRPGHEIAKVTDYGRDWVFVIIRRYNEGGPDALADLRRELPGGKRMLSDEQLDALRERLRSPPDDGGPWNGPKVAAWMSETLSRPVHPQRGWDYMRLLGHPPQIPRSPRARALARSRSS